MHKKTKENRTMCQLKLTEKEKLSCVILLIMSAMFFNFRNKCQKTMIKQRTIIKPQHCMKNIEQ